MVCKGLTKFIESINENIVPMEVITKLLNNTSFCHLCDKPIHQNDDIVRDHAY